MANSGRSSFALCSTPLEYQVCYSPLWNIIYSTGMEYQGILFSLTEGKQWTLYCSAVSVAVNIKQTEEYQANRGE